MNDDLQKLFTIARRHALLARRIVDALRARFDNAAPDTLLSLTRLREIEETRQTIDELATLAALTDTHRRAFRRVLEAFAEESQSLRALDAPGAAPTSALSGVAGLMDAFEQEMRAHAQFFERTQAWVDAATSLCALLDAVRATLSFHDEGIAFEREADGVRYEELLARIASIEHTNELEELEGGARRAEFESRLALEMPSLFTGPIAG